MTAPRGIRGVRESVPAGSVLGRLDSGSGPVSAISLADLTSQLLKTGKLAAGGGGGKQEWSAGTVSAIDPRLTITAGTLDLVSSATQVRTIVFPVLGLIPAGQRCSVPISQPGTLLANGGTPEAFIGTAPGANTTLDVNLIHTGIATLLGTISVSTGGVVTFPTFAATPVSSGDVLQVVAGSVQDANFRDASFSLQYAVSEAVAVPTTEEWTAGTVTAIGAGMALTAGTISATGVQEWTAGTVSALGAGIALAAGTISASGGGGSVLIVNGGSTAVVVGSNTTDAIVPGLSATVTAGATSAMAWVDWFAVTQSGAPTHNMRWRIYLDGTIAFPLGYTARGVNLEEAVNSDGAGWCGGTGFITMPGDSAVHTITAQWQASGSTIPFDIYDRAIKITQ